MTRTREQSDDAQEVEKLQGMLFLQYELLLVRQARQHASQVLGKQSPSVVDPELFALGLRMRPERDEDRIYQDLAKETARLLVIAEKEEQQAKEAES